MNKSSNTILVTGDVGHLGSHKVKILLKNNDTVIILDNLLIGFVKLINKKTRFIKTVYQK